MNYEHPAIKPDTVPSNPAQWLTLRTNVDPKNPNVVIQGPFYRVVSDTSRVPFKDHLIHGFGDREAFREAVENIISQWHDRVGECIEERWFHGKEGYPVDENNCQCRIRFHDTPGCCPDEAWLPRYLLVPTRIPSYARWHDPTPEEQVIDEIDHALWEDKIHR